MRIRQYLLAAGALLALVASPALAYDQGTWILRAGPGVVQPKSNNYSETLNEVDVTGEVRFDIDEATSLVLNGTYMFTPNWGFDVLLAWPFEHDIKMTADVSVVDPLDPLGPPMQVQGSETIATIEQLPPTFSVQYHFMPDSTFQPYVGLGVNWTTFSDERFVGGTAMPLADLGFQDISVDDSWGVAAQLGGDWTFGDHWALNFDVRWIDMQTDVNITTVDPLDPTSIETGSTEFKIDPWVYSINLGYHF